jgi:hypothetical protein
MNMRAMMGAAPGFSLPFSFLSAIRFREFPQRFRILMRSIGRRQARVEPRKHASERQSDPPTTASRLIRALRFAETVEQ